MADDIENPAKVKFEITLLSSDDTNYSDIHYVAFMRTPIIKMASYCIVQINLPIVIISQLQKQLAANFFDIWNMIIYTVDELETDNELELIFDKYFTILSIEEVEPFDLHKTEAVVKLILVNPIFHALETSTSFNEIITESSAYDAIKQYESFIDKTYGECYYNHVGTNEMLNKFKYEQIFIPPTINTLNVPKYIINTYKPFHSYSFYFFDDFYFSDEVDKEITCHFLNFADINNQFPDYEIDDYLDNQRLTRFLKTISFTDPEKFLDRGENISNIYTFQNMFLDFVKGVASLEPKLNMQTKEEINIIDKKEEIVSSQIEYSKTKTSVRSQVIYTPDSKENAEKRIKIAKELMFEKFEKLQIWESEDCLPYWLQFGYLYNIDKNNPEDFLYTPINIINIFRRTEQKGQLTYCSHMSKYLMLKIAREENQSE